MLELGNVVPRDRQHAGGGTKALRLSRLGSPVIQILSDEVEAARRQLAPKCSLALSISTSGAIGGALSHISELGMRRDMGLHPSAI
jgi:hypothetical protein